MIQTAQRPAAGDINGFFGLVVDNISILAFIATVLVGVFGMPAEIVMRHRPTQFGHLFTGEGYSAGYYSYLWADTLTADAAEAFVAAGSFYDKTLAKRLLEFVLSVGNSIPPDGAFKNFRGRDADVSALMRSRGFAIQ